MAERTNIKIGLSYLIFFPVFFVLGLLWHEIIGHGLVGTLAGGQITIIEVLGVNLWPEVHWVGWMGAFAGCEVEFIPTAFGKYLSSLAGSLSTCCVAVLAVILLWIRRWGNLSQIILVCLSLWSFDLLLYILPCWGIPHYIFCGPVRSEPYNAAIKLGIPGPLFQIFAMGTSVGILIGLVICLVRNHKRQRRKIMD